MKRMLIFFGKRNGIEDLGYRNSYYALKVNGVLYKFPTIDEAIDFIEENEQEDSGE